MKTLGSFTHLRRYLLLAFIGPLLGGCAKESTAPTIVAGDEPLVVAKTEPFFLSSASGTCNFNVYKWYSSCVTSYGTISPSPLSFAPNSLVVTGSPTYIRAYNGTTTGVDASYLRLNRGTSAGTFGIWYFIWPTSGPSITTRKGIKVQVKNVTSLPDNAYNQGMQYDESTNTWDVTSAQASGNFNVEVITPGGLTLCPPK